ncbi:MAG: DNA ligase, partial [Clostridia bacterium]|nr:DNA ligase [Clostridia bacterium]
MTGEVIVTPFPLAPMEPVAASRLPEGTDWAFQAKWDGIRLLAAVTRRGVRVCNRRGRDRTAAYPELGALRDLSGDEAVYDGEAVILAEGRPSFPLVMRRELAGRPGGPSLLYVLFDCLGYAGRDLRERPWEARQEVLAHGVRPGDCVRVAGWTRRGQVLWEATARAGWEGVVAKRLDSPYRQGARSGGWIKVKHRRRLDCV